MTGRTAPETPSRTTRDALLPTSTGLPGTELGCYLRNWDVTDRTEMLLTELRRNWGATERTETRLGGMLLTELGDGTGMVLTKMNPKAAASWPY